MARPIPRNPNWRSDNPTRPVRRRERYHAPARDVGYRTELRLLFGFVKIGLFILGAIAVVVFLSALLIHFIWTTMPMLLVALAIIALVIWLVCRS
jgi:hypothetical protein